jgi:hypothetical protein
MVPVNNATIAIVSLVVCGETELQNILLKSFGNIEVSTVAVIDELYDFVETFPASNT